MSLNSSQIDTMFEQYEEHLTAQQINLFNELKNNQKKQYKEQIDKIKEKFRLFKVGTKADKILVGKHKKEIIGGVVIKLDRLSGLYRTTDFSYPFCFEFYIEKVGVYSCLYKNEENFLSDFTELENMILIEKII